jgi:ligand-binding sensor domain-containing protein/two-component sensor histidine kinase
MRLLTRSDIRQSISMREAAEVVKHAFSKLPTGRAGILSMAILALCLSAGLFLPRGARAEQLPVKTYTTADGLLRDQPNRIKLDSRGFLWLCTSDGLSRFDGYGFTNYTTDDGLPHRVVNDLLETRGGAIWVATANGLARFNPRGRRNTADSIRNAAAAMFAAYWPEEKVAHDIDVLFEDAQGKLWCGTDDGLYWFEERDGRVVFHRLDLPKERPDKPLEVLAIIQDRQGTLLIGMNYGHGLNRILPDGRIEHYSTTRIRNEVGAITTLLETQDGEIWAGMSRTGGLCSLVAAPAPGRSILSRCYTKKDGLPEAWINALYQTADGKVWIGTPHGVASFDPHASTSPQFRVYGEAQGLCDEGTSSFHEDREGNLWVATARGVKQIARSDFVRYTERDGLASQQVNAIISSHRDQLFVITGQLVERADKKAMDNVRVINRFDGHRFVPVMPKMPANVSAGWGVTQIVVEDWMGQWWLPSDNKAVFRFPQVSRLEILSSARPQAIAIPDDEVFRLYEDSRGDIWIGTMYYGRVLKWERGAQLLRDYTGELPRPGEAPDVSFQMTCFAEDRQGALWAGFYNHGYLMRYRNGRFMLLPTRGEGSDTPIYGLYFDHAGRLWLASTENGVGRIDAPYAESLKIVWYNRRKGLATDATRNLIEDDFGHIYVGHARGVDRLDPNTGHIKHYTTADGLPLGVILCATRDAQGALWFGGPGGLARLIPEPDRPRPAPAILLTGLRVTGERRPVSELGEESLPALTLDPSQTQVGVDFLGLGASLGEELKYKYKLEGAQNDWSEPSAQRTVDFANLAPGAYRLLVKAITAEGAESAKPASFDFTIMPPFWRRPWFMLLVGAAGTLALYALYRYRLARLLELERMRTRIATDLHDDIGSNLSLIAMLSDVLRRERRGDTQLAESLSQIADAARGLVDSMSDIVWAVNPNKDSVHDLTRRMRRFASEIFSARNIVFKFHAPGEGQDAKLGADIRREVFLIFKEAVNNIARHSNCAEAEIELQVGAGWLLLNLRDNGKGFDDSAASDGAGLMSMRRRAERLGAKFELSSDNGAGAAVTLKVPLGRRG